MTNSLSEPSHFASARMLFRSPTLMKLIAGLGLTLLLVNGAQQCRAICLLVDCHSIKSEGSETGVRRGCSGRCKQAERAIAAARSAVDVSALSQGTNQCPSEEPCVCCDSPAPTNSSSAGDCQLTHGLLSLDANLVACTAELHQCWHTFSVHFNGRTSHTVPVCIALCRLIV